jgi:hypothetical protein
MEKIKFEKVTEILLTSNNSVDTERVFDIEATIRIINSDISSFDGGVVKENNNIICTFNSWNKDNLSTNFQGALDITKMCSILNSINEFTNAVKAKVLAGTTIEI